MHSRLFVHCDIKAENIRLTDAGDVKLMDFGIIRALHRTGGLVVATFRSDELSRLGLGFQTVDERLADHLELAPLSEQDLANLVIRYAGKLTAAESSFTAACADRWLERAQDRRRAG